MGSSEKELLEFIAKSGIIDLSLIESEMAKVKKQEALNKHPFSIWQGKDGYWRTYIPDEQKGRKLVKKKYKDDLFDFIVEIAKVENVSAIFEDAISHKLDSKEIIPSTAMRYRQTFTRHLVPAGLDKRDIRQIGPEEWADFIEKEAGRCDLDSKGLSSLKTVIKMILKRAKRKRLISYTSGTIFDDLDIKPRTNYKKPQDQVFTMEELPELISYLTDHRDVHNLILLLMILSGIRVGEAVALAFDDFATDTTAEIHRTETKYKDDAGIWHHDLKDAPKTEAGFRKIYIPEEYAWILPELRKLRPFAEYLATNAKGERMTTDCIRKRLYRVCDKAGIHRKSTHKARKTFCSILLDAGYDKNFIISVMGHTDITTSEKFYHFDRKTDELKQEMLNNIVEFKAVAK